MKLRNRHFFIIDALLLCLTPTAAMMLRLDTVDIPLTFRSGLIAYTIGALIIRLIVFFEFRLYRRYWRYASIDELIQIGIAVLTATFLIAIPFIFIRSVIPFPFPRSVVFIDGLLTLFLVGGIRFSVRMADRISHRASMEGGKRVLVMGAGEAGGMVVRELQRNPQLNQIPIGFLDDDPAKQGMSIRGVPVLGTREDIPHIVRFFDVKRVIIAMPTAPGTVIRQIVKACEEVGVETKTIPGIYELLDDTVSISQIRDVDIEDLLRREPVKTDFTAVEELLAGKRVLVTGGGGSIGSELCRQAFRCNPAQLIILGHGENSIFEICQELQLRQTKSSEIVPLIADTRFPERVRLVLDRYRPEIIFHAAAHKHVPLMEMNPAEAVTNNILGTKVLLDAALKTGVDRFVMISTDKAVRPTSVMGASKRVAELLVLRAARENGRHYVSVRFGNVLGSRGSVVLTFKKQIAAGSPVTVTDAHMKRYFMTIPEAVQLVLQASVLGQGGEVLMLDMGEPHAIVDLAKDLIALSGLELGRDIEIEFTGPRPGEKLFEELFIPGESYQRTQHEKIFIVAGASGTIPADLEAAIDQLEDAARRDERKAMIRGLQHLVPEFTPSALEEGETARELRPSLLETVEDPGGPGFDQQES